jgi:hypothetical protein
MRNGLIIDARTTLTSASTLSYLVGCVLAVSFEPATSIYSTMAWVNFLGLKRRLVDQPWIGNCSHAEMRFGLATGIPDV